MGIDGASQRTATAEKRQRYYFPRLHPWVDFETAVATFQEDPAITYISPMPTPLSNFLLFRGDERMIKGEDEIRYLSSALTYLEP